MLACWCGVLICRVLANLTRLARLLSSYFIVLSVLRLPGTLNPCCVSISLCPAPQEKDVFEKYYKQHLAKRLLHGRSTSEDSGG